MKAFVIGVAVGFLIYLGVRAYFRAKAGERLILELLATAPFPLYGLELIERSRGELGHGTVYVLLGRLEDRGLVSWIAEANGRHRYMLTAKAKARRDDLMCPTCKLRGVYCTCGRTG